MSHGMFSDYRVEKWLDELSSVWFSLHYDDPQTAGDYASEIFGGSYARVKGEMTEATGRVIFNSSDILFKGLPTVVITHIGGWNTKYNGDLEFSLPLPEPVRVLAGKQFLITGGELALNLP